jgi:hypothetical protein
MSNAPFGAPNSLIWRPREVAHLTQNVDVVGEVVVLDPASLGYVRIDYASLVLSYAGATDGNASAELCLKYDDDVVVPFLAVASFAPIYVEDVLDVYTPLPSPLYTNKYLAQLSLPFVIMLGCTIVLQGETGGFDVSTIDATVAYSCAWPV